MDQRNERLIKELRQRESSRNKIGSLNKMGKKGCAMNGGEGQKQDIERMGEKEKGR